MKFDVFVNGQKAGFDENQTRDRNGRWNKVPSIFDQDYYGSPAWNQCLRSYARNPTNLAFHSRTGGEAMVREELACIKHGLAQIPPFKGVSYRGVAVPPDVLSDILDEAKTGEMTFPGITSSSMKKNVAFIYGTEGRFRTGAHRVLFVLDGKTGRDISPYVRINQEWEKEVLFDQGTKWNVVKVDEDNDGIIEYTRIFLKEK